jgi:hypothetical protein
MAQNKRIYFIVYLLLVLLVYNDSIIQLEQKLIMRMTNNRKLILQALANNDGYDLPPFSASSIRYTLENAFNFKWQGYDMNAVASIAQIHRTLRDLWRGGLIVGTRVKCDVHNLPHFEIRYQVAADVEKNHIISECQTIHSKLSKAVNGFNFFGAIIDRGLNPDDVKQLSNKVRLMMQRTHPDKSPDYLEQFHLMRECHEMIQAGIPLLNDISNATKGNKGMKSVVKK